jgi:hypothetical protein
VRVIEHSKPKNVKPNTRERKLRNCVKWQSVLKLNGVKQRLDYSDKLSYENWNVAIFMYIYMCVYTHDINIYIYTHTG